MQYIVTPKGEKYLERIGRMGRDPRKSHGAMYMVMTGIQENFLEEIFSMSPQDVKDDARRALGGALEKGYIDIVQEDDF